MLATGAMKVAKGYTNDDLAYEIARLHDCVHTVGEKVEKVATDVGVIKAKVEEHSSEIAYIKGVQSGVSQRLGVRVDDHGQVDPELKPALSLWFAKPWKIIAAGFGSLAGGILFYKLVAATLVPIALAIHHALMTVS